jgi:hypothetical protein
MEEEEDWPGGGHRSLAAATKHPDQRVVAAAPDWQALRRIGRRRTPPSGRHRGRGAGGRAARLRGRW